MPYTSDRIPTHPAVLRGVHGELRAIVPIDETHVALYALMVTAEERRHDFGETNDGVTLTVDGHGNDALDAGDNDRCAVYAHASDDNASGAATVATLDPFSASWVRGYATIADRRSRDHVQGPREWCHAAEC